MKRSLVSLCFVLLLVSGALAPLPAAAQGTVDGPSGPPLELVRLAQQSSEPLAPGVPTGLSASGGAGTAGVLVGGEGATHLGSASHLGPDVGSALHLGDELSAPLAATKPQPGPYSSAAVSYTGHNPASPDIVVRGNDVIVVYNDGFTVYYKNQPGIERTSRTWSDLMSNLGLPAGTIYHSPRAIYDFINHHFLIVVLARYGTGNLTQAWYVVLVSTDDPADLTWYLYKFNAVGAGQPPAIQYPENPAIGADGKNLYIAADMFDSGDGFLYAKIRMLKLDELYQGSTASGWIDFHALRHEGDQLARGVVPAHHYVASDPMYFISAGNNLSQTSGNILSVFRIALPPGNNWPGVPPTLNRLFPTATTSEPFVESPDARQLGSAALIDTGDTRILSARQYAGHLWVTQACRDAVPNPDVSNLCIYGLRTTDGSLFFQQSGYGDKTHDYFAPALALDQHENMVVAFSRSGPDEYASIRYAGMKAGETSLSSSLLLKAGLDTFDRPDWGPRAGIERDPQSNEMFFMFHQYAAHPLFGLGRWGTWIGSAFYPTEFVFLPVVMR